MAIGALHPLVGGCLAPGYRILGSYLFSESPYPLRFVWENVKEMFAAFLCRKVPYTYSLPP